MKYLISIIALLLLTFFASACKSKTASPITPVAGTGSLTPPANPDKFVFAAFGDNQGQKGETTIRTIFQEIREHKPVSPAFAVSTGDIVKGKDPERSDAQLRKKFQDYLNIAKLAGVPVYNAPGNHEMDDHNDIPNAKLHKIYQEVVAPLYGSFSYGNSHFVLLNTEDLPPAGTKAPPKPLEFSYIGKAQLSWLNQELAANKDKTHIFIFMHYPIKPANPRDQLNPESVKALQTIFKQYNNISYVVASHEHQYYNPQDPKNFATIKPYTSGQATKYLVSGGAGAWLSAKPNLGGFYHYLVFQVDGKSVKVTIRKP